MTRSLNVTLKTTLRSGKSKLLFHGLRACYWIDWLIEWMNDKRLRSIYYFVEANYWRTQSIARPLCNTRTTCWLHVKCTVSYLIGIASYRKSSKFCDAVAQYCSGNRAGNLDSFPREEAAHNAYSPRYSAVDSCFQCLSICCWNRLLYTHWQ